MFDSESVGFVYKTDLIAAAADLWLIILVGLLPCVQLGVEKSVKLSALGFEWPPGICHCLFAVVLFLTGNEVWSSHANLPARWPLRAAGGSMFMASACNLAWFTLESGAWGVELVPHDSCLLLALIHAGALPLTIASLSIMCGETPLSSPTVWLTTLSGMVFMVAAMLQSLACFAVAVACALGAINDMSRLILLEQRIVWRAPREVGLTRPVFQAVRILQPMWIASFALEVMMLAKPTVSLDALASWVAILTVATSRVAVSSSANIKAVRAYMSADDMSDRAV
ncbi:unnamed protein product [Symbiodinium natans]|uniref:Transmembrane protein n=1 Tax=Symbiodinium natans TaxID=878477 RepID=A0A812IYU2_9DINO|nr:unnamed protein product [Symbiodinium natans]